MLIKVKRNKQNLKVSTVQITWQQHFFDALQGIPLLGHLVHQAVLKRVGKVENLSRAETGSLDSLTKYQLVHLSKSF